MHKSIEIIWKQVKGFEGLYEISNLGEVKSFRGKTRKHQQVSGYPSVILSKEKKLHRKYIHRLVAEVFIPTDDFTKQVNHIDGNKLNFSIENLEWTTVTENIQHAYRNNLKPNHTGIGKSKVTPEIRQEMKRLFSTGMKRKEIGKLFSNTPEEQVSRIINDKI